MENFVVYEHIPHVCIIYFNATPNGKHRYVEQGILPAFGMKDQVGFIDPYTKLETLGRFMGGCLPSCNLWLSVFSPKIAQVVPQNAYGAYV